MITLRRFAIGILFILLLTSGSYLTVFADPITNPTHFDDTYWDWPSNSSGYTEMDTDITPVADGSSNGYYFSAYYWFSGDYPATGGYLGMQTEGTVPTGKIAIFSIWGATSSSGPGYNTSGNESGTYYTSRISYPWVVNNTYDLSISLINTSGGNNTWEANVTDLNTGQKSLIGDIIVPSSRGNLYDVSNTFHERYAGDTSSCSSLNLSEVKFTNLTANNGSVAPTSHSNVGPTTTGCASDFATEDISGGIQTIIGGQFPVPASVPTPVPRITVTPIATPNPATTTTTLAPASNPTVSTSKTTTSTLSSLTITVTNTNGQKIIGAKVVLNSNKAAYSDSKGEVAFTKLSPGVYSLRITSKNTKPISEKIAITSSPTKKSIHVTLTSSIKKTKISIFLAMGIIAGILLLISSNYYLRRYFTRRSNIASGLPASVLSPPSPSIADTNNIIINHSPTERALFNNELPTVPANVIKTIAHTAMSSTIESAPIESLIPTIPQPGEGNSQDNSQSLTPNP